MFERAKQLGDKLVVIINNDNWLLAKKGFVFMPEKERVTLISGFSCVDEVVLTDHIINDPDRSVCRSLEKIQPDIFGNGGDRKNIKDIPETTLCEKYGIEMVFNLGTKIQSSSWLINKAARRRFIEERPWGKFENLDTGNLWNLKTITVAPKKRLSLQNHRNRAEFWITVEGKLIAELRKTLKSKPRIIKLKQGETFSVPKGYIHRLSSEKGGKIVEVSFGHFDEKDIIRYEDDYGRVSKEK